MMVNRIRVYLGWARLVGHDSWGQTDRYPRRMKGHGVVTGLRGHGLGAVYSFIGLMTHLSVSHTLSSFEVRHTE
jgi:hypothetical protein